jgi:hypothetical protein
MTSNIEQAFDFTEVCAALSERFGTSFELENTGGNCVTLMAKLECGMELLITDCEGTLSPVKCHLDGRAAGLFVGVYRAWCRQVSDWAIDRQLSRDQQLSHSRDQGLDYGMEL